MREGGEWGGLELREGGRKAGQKPIAHERLLTAKEGRKEGRK